MRFAKWSLFLLAAALSASNPALAADPKAIIGAWIETLPNGYGMVTEFTPSTISAYAVDTTGARVSTPITKAVSYRDLGATIGVDFKEGGGLLVMVQSPKAIVLDFPDAGSHNLSPFKPVSKIGPQLTPPSLKAN